MPISVWHDCISLAKQPVGSVTLRWTKIAHAVTHNHNFTPRFWAKSFTSSTGHLHRYCLLLVLWWTIIRKVSLCSSQLTSFSSSLFFFLSPFKFKTKKTFFFCAWAWCNEFDLFLIHFEKKMQWEYRSDGSLGFVFKRGFVREMEGLPLFSTEVVGHP